MKKILFFSILSLFLIQFGTTAWSLGLKLPDLPETKAEIYLAEVDLSFTPGFPLPKSFPSLTEAKGGQFSSDYCPGTAMNSKTWDKVKGTWHGPVVDVIKKVTGDTNNNVFIWTVIHSFFDSVTDAKAHSRGKTKYFKGDVDWHIWKNCRDFSAVMITLNFGRRIFIEKITVKETARDLMGIGLLRFVVHNTTMKIVKGGFPAYNDPYYNQHSLPYWGFKNGKLTDKYIATGRVTTPLFDGLAITGFIFVKSWKF